MSAENMTDTQRYQEGLAGTEFKGHRSAAFTSGWNSGDIYILFLDFITTTLILGYSLLLLASQKASAYTITASISISL